MLLSPAADFVRGFKTYMRGVQWLRRHRPYLWSLLVPWAGGLGTMTGGVILCLRERQVLVARLLYARPASWPQLGLYYGLEGLLLLSVLLLVLVASALVVSLLAAPVYERISRAVEHELTGEVAAAGGGFGHSLRLMGLEVKKMSMIMALSLLLLLIPGINIGAGLLAAALAGWDLFDYPLARRGWPLARRLALARQEFWSIVGFSLWLAIPLIQVFTLPLAVAGATFLNLDALARHRLLTPKRSEETGDVV